MQEARAGEFVGVDVCKAHLDIHFHPGGRQLRVDNTDDGVGKARTLFVERSVTRVVLESTGPYGQRLQKALHEAGVPVHCVPPQRVRKFAQAIGIKAKTDAIDAAVIARYAATVEFPTVTPPTAAAQKLNALVVRRQQLIEMETVLRNHRRTAADVDVAQEDLLPVLRRNVRALDQAMVDVIEGDEGLRRRANAIKSVRGVGPVLVATLLAFVPELGKCSGKQMASLIGVAPFNNDSGARRGQRSIRGGRFRVRSVLYMSARVAARFQPEFKEFYSRLKASKPDKVAVTGVMRKLIVVLNARVRDALKDEAAEPRPAELPTPPALSTRSGARRRSLGAAEERAGVRGGAPRSRRTAMSSQGNKQSAHDVVKRREEPGAKGERPPSLEGARESSSGKASKGGRESEPSPAPPCASRRRRAASRRDSA